MMGSCFTIKDLVECFWVLSFDGDFVWDVDRVCLEVVELLVQSEGFRHPVLAARGERNEPLEGGRVSRRYVRVMREEEGL